MNETFNVHIKFTSGDSTVESDKNIAAVHSSIQRLMTGPAAIMGLIKEIKVIDSGDCIVFHAEDGKVLFPRR